MIEGDRAKMSNLLPSREDPNFDALDEEQGQQLRSLADMLPRLRQLDACKAVAEPWLKDSAFDGASADIVAVKKSLLEMPASPANHIAELVAYMFVADAIICTEENVAGQVANLYQFLKTKLGMPKASLDKTVVEKLDKMAKDLSRSG